MDQPLYSNQKQIKYYYTVFAYWFASHFDKGEHAVDKHAEYPYYQRNNGKRFVAFKADKRGCFLSIREDGDTRTVYHGLIQHTDQLKVIWDTIW